MLSSQRQCITNTNPIHYAYMYPPRVPTTRTCTHHAYVCVQRDETDKLIDEMESSIKDWRGKLMVALREQKFEEYYKVKNQIATLLEWRRQLQQSTSTSEQDSVRVQVIKLIESRRQMDEAFTVPRTEGNDIATVTNSTITELHDKVSEGGGA